MKMQTKTTNDITPPTVATTTMTIIIVLLLLPEFYCKRTNQINSYSIVLYRMMHGRRFRYVYLKLVVVVAEKLAVLMAAKVVVQEPPYH